MKASNSSSNSIVASPEQCRILLNPVYRSFIKSLMSKPSTLSDLVQELGMTMDKVFYRVKQLEELGLVHVVRTEPRRGKPLRYYAATSSRYEIPFANTPSASLDELILGQVMERQEVFRKYLMRNIVDRLQESGKEPSFFIEIRNENLVMDLEIIEENGMNSTIVYWHPVHIKRSDATRIFEEIVALIKRYSQETLPEERSEYLLGIQLVRKY